MPTRDERKAAAASNLALMRGAFSKDTQETVDAAIIYEDGEGRELELPEVEEGAATTTSVTSDFTVKAVHSAKGKTVVVDPCSFMRPGGAYEDGAFVPSRSCVRKATCTRFCAAAKTRIMPPTAGLRPASFTPIARCICPR